MEAHFCKVAAKVRHGWGTPSGKVELVSEAAGGLGQPTVMESRPAQGGTPFLSLSLLPHLRDGLSNTAYRRGGIIEEKLPAIREPLFICARPLHWGERRG